MKTLTICGIILLAVLNLNPIENVFAKQIETNINKKLNLLENNEARQRRAIKKPGFFWTLGSSIFQQYNETKSAYQQIMNLINDQFTDGKKPARTRIPPPTTTPSTSTSSTEEPYRISRREFNKIIMRNLRGLHRLYNLELQQALKQSEQTRRDFNKQLRLSIRNELS